MILLRIVLLTTAFFLLTSRGKGIADKDSSGNEYFQAQQILQRKKFIS